MFPYPRWHDTTPERVVFWIQLLSEWPNLLVVGSAVLIACVGFYFLDKIRKP